MKKGDFTLTRVSHSDNFGESLGIGVARADELSDIAIDLIQKHNSMSDVLFELSKSPARLYRGILECGQLDGC